MKRLVFISVFCCLFGSMVLAQVWVNFTKTSPESPIFSLTSSSNQLVAFTVEVCGIYKQNITEGNETFQRIEIPSGGALSETGDPELPYIRQLIAIPECEDVVLTATINGQTSFSNYNVYPAPDFVESQDQNGGVFLQEVFSKSGTTYAQNSTCPG